MTASLEALIGDTVTDVEHIRPATTRVSFDSGRAIEIEGAPYMEPLEDFETDGGA